MSFREDAKTAKEKIKLVDGRNVHIHFSQPRVGKKSKKGKNESDDTKEEANPEADKTGKTACDMKGENILCVKMRDFFVFQRKTWKGGGGDNFGAPVQRSGETRFFQDAASVSFKRQS